MPPPLVGAFVREDNSDIMKNTAAIKASFAT
jgi:hypothetical protein